MKFIGTAFCALCLLAPLRAATVADLQVTQAITDVDGSYAADPKIRIAFTSGEPGEVTVEIASHLAFSERSSQYLAEPPVVRTLKLGRLEAGRHEVFWDGFGENGQPVVQKFLKRRKDLLDWAQNEGKTPGPDDLVGEKAVELFEIRVRAGKECAATNFRRLDGAVPDSRKVPTGLEGALSDGDGGYFALSGSKWRAWHFNAQGNLLAEYPARPETWNGNVPVEAKQVSLANDKVYVMSQGNALLRFNLDGSEAPWESKADFIRGPRLGVTVSKPKPGSTNKLVQGGKQITYDTDQATGIASQPGFALGWGGADVDGKFVYLVRNSPAQELQIFDLAGAYVRSLPLPPDSYSGVRCNGQGLLWLLGPRGPKLFDPESGKLVRTLRNPPGGGSFNGLSVGSDGTFYAWTANAVFRFTKEGDPRLFDPSKGFALTPAEKAPNSGGLTTKILSVAGDRDGNLMVFTTDETKELTAKHATPRMLVFDANGDYVPSPLPDVTIGSQRPGNVFVEAEPARVVLFLTSLAKEEAPGRLEWSVTDYDGTKKQGTFDFKIAPLARQAITVPLSAENFGYYQWEAKMFVGGRLQTALTSSAARIRRRDLAPSQDSPFAMVWGRDFYLMGLAGVKKERVGSTSWSQVEPFDGVLAPELEDVTTGFLALRREAARWGLRIAEMFNYGEPWTSKGWLIQIHSFDRYFRHILSLVDRIDDASVEHFQFWNEPNNFWKLPGPFNREHYAVVAKNCWSIVKARSKENSSICDGDATTFGMMQELADNGAAAYNDAVECHYLGASSVTINAMKNNVPETKAASFDSLVKLRDRYYPGKPILDTEEGTWGNRGLSLAAGAQSIPRVHVPLLAAGLDALYWFRFSCAPDDIHSSYLLDVKSLPQPAYCSYATMTRILEGAESIGRIDCKDPAVYAYLFIRSGQAIVPIWTAGENVSVDLPAGMPTVNMVVDTMDRQSQVRGTSLKLSQDIQYVVFPCNDWTKEQIEAELGRRLASLKSKDVAALPQEIAASTKGALADAAQMSRLFYLVRAAKLAALAGDPVTTHAAAGKDARTAKQAILKREGADAYLANARLVLSWAEKFDRSAAKQDAQAAARFRTVSSWIAAAASQMAEMEKPIYPGVAINAFIGDAGEIEKIRGTLVSAPDYPLVDPQFRYEIPRKPGESFSLELSVWNYYRHPIEGEIAPRLPEGWTASVPKKNFSLQPGEFARFTCEVSIPSGAKLGEYKLGGRALYAGQGIEELHAQRIVVGGPAGAPPASDPTR